MATSTPPQLPFTAKRVQHVREVTPSRLEDLQALADRQHAEVFRDHAFLPVKDQVAVLRRLLEGPQARRLREQDC